MDFFEQVERLSTEELHAEVARRLNAWSPALSEIRKYHYAVDILAERLGVDDRVLRHQLWTDRGIPDNRSPSVDELRAAWRARSHAAALVTTLEADSPWRFADGNRRGGAGTHYRTLTVPQLCAYPLPPLARDARLFFWRVAAMQREALDVIKAWGFRLVSEIVWIKTTQSGRILIIDEDGRIKKGPKLNSLNYGMGFQTRMCHEVCLIATRGSPKRTAHHRSVFFAPVPRGLVPRKKDGKLVSRPIHSKKPDAFYRIVESMSPGPRYSLFSRDERDNWMVDGDESPNAIQLN